LSTNGNRAFLVS